MRNRTKQRRRAESLLQVQTAGGEGQLTTDSLQTSAANALLPDLLVFRKLQEGRRGTHAVWAAPFALGSLLQLRVQADQVVGSGTRVTQDDFSPLLADLAVVLMVGLVSVPVFCWRRQQARTGPAHGRLMFYCRFTHVTQGSDMDLLFFFLRTLLLFFLAVAPRASKSTEALWMLMSSKSDSSRKSSSLWEMRQVQMCPQAKTGGQHKPKPAHRGSLLLLPTLALGFGLLGLGLLLHLLGTFPPLPHSWSWNTNSSSIMSVLLLLSLSLLRAFKPSSKELKL